MARAMASALRVKNTAYFDIAACPLPPAHPGIPASPAGWRLVAQDATDKPARPIGRYPDEGTARGGRRILENEGQLDRGRRDRQGAQLGVAAATSPPDPGQRRAEIVVAGALAQQDPQVVSCPPSNASTATRAPTCCGATTTATSSCRCSPCGTRWRRSHGSPAPTWTTPSSNLLPRRPWPATTPPSPTTPWWSTPSARTPASASEPAVTEPITPTGPRTRFGHGCRRSTARQPGLGVRCQGSHPGWPAACSMVWPTSPGAMACSRWAWWSLDAPAGRRRCAAGPQRWGSRGLAPGGAGPPRTPLVGGSHASSATLRSGCTDSWVAACISVRGRHEDEGDGSQRELRGVLRRHGRPAARPAVPGDR